MFTKHYKRGSPDWRKNMSKVKKGKSNGRTGIKHSEETKKKISDSLTGRKLSEETKKKISNSHKTKES